MEKAKEMLIKEANYSIVVRLASVSPFKKTVNEILAKKNDGINFKCYSGLHDDSFGECVMSGPIEKADVIEQYVKEALDKYPTELKKPKIRHRVDSEWESNWVQF
jgi:hypothetical protein